MPVTIDFRGVMLFRCNTDRGTLEDILIPYAEADSSWPVNGYHPDGSVARPHFAGLVFEREGVPRHVPLKRTTVAIVMDSASTGPSIELTGLPKLKPATYGTGEVDPAGAATAITILGGQLRRDPTLPPSVRSKPFVNRIVSHHGAQLRGNTAIITVTGDVNETLEFSSDERIIVYSYEDAEPSVRQLDHIGACEFNMAKDDDFIWLYSLMRDWDKTTNAHPAPVVFCEPDPSVPGWLRPNLITVFTCFPAVWESDT